jgi:adenylyltransferase/sulfurtransferase
MDDQQLLRYSRHVLLDGFGVEGQAKLAQSTVLVVGAGGLGSAALPYLASAGVGRIIVADGDMVDLTNLQRQILYRESSIGTRKAASARNALLALNSTIEVMAVEEHLSSDRLGAIVAGVDLVLDCSDNFVSRHAINAACVKYQKPLVSGAAIRFDGQLSVFDFRLQNSPCYACVFPDEVAAEQAEEDRCGVMGVFAPLVGVIGAMQASEALGLLANVGESSVGRLHLFTAKNMRWREVRVKRDTHCLTCGSLATSAAISSEVGYA